MSSRAQRGISQFAVLPAAFLWLAGCRTDLAPANPHPEVLQVRGDRQRGFEHAVLGDSIVVAVKAPDGSPVVGAQVSFVAAGGGAPSSASVISDQRGIAAVAWQLGAASSTQTLTAWVGDRPENGVVASFQATPVPAASADTLVVDDPAGDRHIAFFDASAIASVEQRTLSSGERRLTLLPVEPDAATRSGVAVFSAGRPPAVVDGIRWSSAPDTVRIRFPDPVSARVAVWMVSTGIQVADVRDAATQAAGIWSQWGVRIALDDIDIRDVSNTAAAETLRGALPPCSGGPAVGFTQGKINIYLIDGLIGHSGFSCDGYVLITRFRLDGRLWAHELGHQFGLGHATTSDNVMYPTFGGTRLNEGQAFRAHMHSKSVLNTLFGATPAGSRRDCDAMVKYAVPLAITRCLREDFTFAP